MCYEKMLLVVIICLLVGCCNDDEVNTLDVREVPDDAVDGNMPYHVEGLKLSPYEAKLQMLNDGRHSMKIKYVCCHDGRYYYFLSAISLYGKPSSKVVFRNGVRVDGISGSLQYAPKGGRR